MLLMPLLVVVVSEWRGVVKTVKVRSKSALRAMIVVISLTVMRLTSSPSIATIRSPGVMVSANTLVVRTPETTVPRESALLAKIIPSLPGGAWTVMRLRRAVAGRRLEELGVVAVAATAVRPTRDRPMLRSSPEVVPPPPTAVAAGPPEPTMANCISNRSKSLATLRLCSDI
jgi:hypothetical protein